MTSATSTRPPGPAATGSADTGGRCGVDVGSGLELLGLALPVVSLLLLLLLPELLLRGDGFFPGHVVPEVGALDHLPLDQHVGELVQEVSLFLQDGVGLVVSLTQ